MEFKTLALHGVTVFIGFFAIMNPVANLPVFLAVTAGDDTDTRRAVARRALLLAFFLIAVFSILGKFVFEMFGIGLPALRLVGGILVLKIGLDMLNGTGSAVQTPSEQHQKDSRDAALSVAITPLALPLLAGPGTIATAMNFSAGEGALEMGVTVLAFSLLCLVTYAVFQSGEAFVKYIGASALGVITRLMGLILATIGVQMGIAGIKGAFQLP